jgi:hypothetical protein
VDRFWDQTDQFRIRCLLQYYIDLMGLKFQLTENEEVEEIQDELVLRISESVK